MCYPKIEFFFGFLLHINNYNVIFKNVNIINSVLGSYTFIQKNSMIINADIGKFCSIAANVSISLGKHPISHVSSHPAFYSATQPLAKTFSKEDSFEPFDKRVKIGNDVWIGQNAMVMNGVKIGTGAIIGAGSVVTRDVPEYAIVGGVPAELIRYRFDEEMRKKLLETKWWDMDESIIQECHGLFSDPKKFLKINNHKEI